jgi:hypothetical protein
MNRVLEQNLGSVADARFSLYHSGLGFLRLRFAAPTAEGDENGLVKLDRS